MTILTDEDIGELKRDYGFGICDLNWWEATRAIEAAVIDRIKSLGAVGFAYYSPKYKKPLLELTDKARGYEGEWVKVPLYRIED